MCTIDFLIKKKRLSKYIDLEHISTKKSLSRRIFYQTIENGHALSKEKNVLSNLWEADIQKNKKQHGSARNANII